MILVREITNIYGDHGDQHVRRSKKHSSPGLAGRSVFCRLPSPAYSGRRLDIPPPVFRRARKVVGGEPG